MADTTKATPARLTRGNALFLLDGIEEEASKILAIAEAAMAVVERRDGTQAEEDNHSIEHRLFRTIRDQASEGSLFYALRDLLEQLPEEVARA